MPVYDYIIAECLKHVMSTFISMMGKLSSARAETVKSNKPINMKIYRCIRYLFLTAKLRKVESKTKEFILFFAETE